MRRLRLRRLRLGLRGRVSAAFAVGALGVSLLLAFTTYAIASNYLLEQRKSTVLRQAVFNAGTVSDALLTTQPAIADLLERVDAGGGESSSPLVHFEGRWYDSRFGPGHQHLPEAFTAAALRGEPVWQRIQTPGGLAAAIALPMEASGGVYVEVFSLREIDRTLTILAVTFTGTATMTTLLGLLLGLWASRRSLMPLTAVTSAAGAIAEGDLGARLDGHRDPDLTALAQAFNKTADRLQARVARDARFAGNVSHELRSPVTTMVNAVELLQDRAGNFDEESREILHLLAGDVHRFAAMVEDLLEISRVDSGAAVSSEPVRVGLLVGADADRCAGRPVTVVDAGARDLVCSADRRRLERVVENLVRNAQTHGEGVSRVWVGTHGEAVFVIVEDHGPGVPAGEEERIFERFSRGTGKRSGQGGGVGLGLSLVREHVRLHGGRVWAEHRQGGGTRFVVRLPVEGDTTE